jgi:hypothetical protein
METYHGSSPRMVFTRRPWLPAQFEGHTISPMYTVVRKVWASPKCKLFVWLVIQNRVWTADRLELRGWPNYGLCPLCKQVQETSTYLLCHCRFSVRVWCDIVAWLGLQDVNPRDWGLMGSVAIGGSRSHKPEATQGRPYPPCWCWSLWSIGRSATQGSSVQHRRGISFVGFRGAKYFGSVMPREWWPFFLAHRWALLQTFSLN